MHQCASQPENIYKHTIFAVTSFYSIYKIGTKYNNNYYALAKHYYLYTVLSPFLYYYY